MRVTRRVAVVLVVLSAIGFIRDVYGSDGKSSDLQLQSQDAAVNEFSNAAKTVNEFLHANDIALQLENIAELAAKLARGEKINNNAYPQLTRENILILDEARTKLQKKNDNLDNLPPKFKEKLNNPKLPEKKLKDLSHLDMMEQRQQGELLRKLLFRKDADDFIHDVARYNYFYSILNFLDQEDDHWDWNKDDEKENQKQISSTVEREKEDLMDEFDVFSRERKDMADRKERDALVLTTFQFMDDNKNMDSRIAFEFMGMNDNPSAKVRQCYDDLRDVERELKEDLMKKANNNEFKKLIKFEKDLLPQEVLAKDIDALDTIDDLAKDINALDTIHNPHELMQKFNKIAKAINLKTYLYIYHLLQTQLQTQPEDINAVLNTGFKAAATPVESQPFRCSSQKKCWPDAPDSFRYYKKRATNQRQKRRMRKGIKHKKNGKAKALGHKLQKSERSKMTTSRGKNLGSLKQKRT